MLNLRNPGMNTVSAGAIRKAGPSSWQNICILKSKAKSDLSKFQKENVFFFFLLAGDLGKTPPWLHQNYLRMTNLPFTLNVLFLDFLEFLKGRGSLKNEKL